MKNFNLNKITLKTVLNSCNSLEAVRDSYNCREAVRGSYNCREAVRGSYNCPEAVRDSYNCSPLFFVKEKHFLKNKWEAVLRCHLRTTVANTISFHHFSAKTNFRNAFEMFALLIFQF